MSVSTEETSGGARRINLLLAPQITIIVTRPPEIGRHLMSKGVTLELPSQSISVPFNPYIAGDPVKGQEGFFGREDIFGEVMQMLRHPQSNAMALYGQRRIGKTSALLELERRLA